MDQKYFIQAFANAGDKTTVPEPVQPSGSVSFAQGWTFDYQRQLGVDVLAKPMDRAETNYLFFALTDAAGQYQRYGAPEFITTADNGGAPFSYAAGVVVNYRASGLDPFVPYVSLVAGNNVIPGSDPTKWQVLLYAEATQVQAEAGLLGTVIMTPRRVKNYIDANPPTIPDATESVKGKAELATTAEAQAFTDDTRIVTPLKLGQAIPAASTTAVGRTRFATTLETTTGTLATVATTPAGVAAVAALKLNVANPTATGTGTLNGAASGSTTYWVAANPAGVAIRVGANGNTSGVFGTTTNHPISLQVNSVEAVNIPIGVGAVTCTRAINAAGGYQNTSSRKAKNLDGPLPYGLAELLNIETAIGSYKPEYYDDGGRKRLFVIAEQLAEHVPEPVFAHHRVPGVDYMQLVPLLIRALQDEHAARVEEAAGLRTELARLAARLDELEF